MVLGAIVLGYAGVVILGGWNAAVTMTGLSFAVSGALLLSAGIATLLVGWPFGDG